MGRGTTNVASSPTTPLYSVVSKSKFWSLSDDTAAFTSFREVWFRQLAKLLRRLNILLLARLVLLAAFAPIWCWFHGDRHPDLVRSVRVVEKRHVVLVVSCGVRDWDRRYQTRKHTVSENAWLKHFATAPSPTPRNHNHSHTTPCKARTTTRPKRNGYRSMQCSWLV